MLREILSSSSNHAWVAVCLKLKLDVSPISMAQVIYELESQSLAVDVAQSKIAGCTQRENPARLKTKR